MPLYLTWKIIFASASNSFLARFAGGKAGNPFSLINKVVVVVVVVR